MERALEQLVWQRAAERCEYCQVSQSHDRLTFEIDHVIARKHRGRTQANNLCLPCLAWIQHSYCLLFELVGIHRYRPSSRRCAMAV
jgi:hypothetical protein